MQICARAGFVAVLRGRRRTGGNLWGQVSRFWILHWKEGKGVSQWFCYILSLRDCLFGRFLGYANTANGSDVRAPHA